MAHILLVENTEHLMQETSLSDSCSPIRVALTSLGDMPEHWMQATSSYDSRHLIRAAHVSLVADMSVNRNRQHGTVCIDE
jgi:hypothetical protein